MQQEQPSDFRIIRFLIASGRVGVHQVSPVAVAANGLGLSPIDALVNFACITEGELAVAIDAVQAIDNGMSHVMAVEMFELALEKNLSFYQAVMMTSVETVRLGQLLMEGKFVTKTQLESALTLTSWGDVLIGEALVRIKAISLVVLQNSLKCQALVNSGALSVEQAIFVLHYATNFQVSCEATVEKFQLKAS